jgi:hypothetical protein
VAGVDGGESLLLAVPEPAESALFLPEPRLYRILLDPSAPPHPGVTVCGLLGRDDDGAMDVTVESIGL